MDIFGRTSTLEKVLRVSSYDAVIAANVYILLGKTDCRKPNGIIIFFQVENYILLLFSNIMIFFCKCHYY